MTAQPKGPALYTDTDGNALDPGVKIIALSDSEYWDEGQQFTVTVVKDYFGIKIRGGPFIELRDLGEHHPNGWTYIVPDFRAVTE
jgi:hypothetical protein